MAISILNIAAGKFKPLELPVTDEYFLINLDTMYYDFSDPLSIEREHSLWDKKFNREVYCKADAFEFMERTKLMFDRICVYRFLEHVSFTQVLYFIYLLSTCLKKGGHVDIIVPNYAILANMILKEDPLDPAGANFEAHNTELTTELLNEPSCPHASIWTDKRVEYLFTLENRFEIVDLTNHYDYDGRNLYIRFWAKRI